MKRRYPLIVFLALALVAAACSDTTGVTAPSSTSPPSTPPTTGPSTPSTTLPDPGPSVILARADLPRATTTDVTPGEIEALVAGNTSFAFDLFGRLAADGDNVILSPYSIAAALTMTYAGARGDTAAEMREVLHLGLGDDRIHTGRNELDLRITAALPAAPDDERQPFTIRVANSLWGQQGYPFLDEFLALLAAEYDAGMNLVDFVTAAEEARRTINAWVEEQTSGRIVDLIPAGVIDSLTTLVLVNAIWFKANWEIPFDPERTADGTFTTGTGDVATVPLMHGGGSVAYAAGDGFQAVRLPYAGAAAMLVILPDPGRFAEVAARLGPEELAGIEASLTEHHVDLTMPSFEFRTELALAPLLAALGMPEAFTPPPGPGTADFTGITERRELYIQEVVHQAFIAVDETGTEAAAATAVVVGRTSAPPPATMTIDRPFLFLIEHTGSGEILFLGQVTDPS